MKDPPRLVDDNPSALERALLDAGASYRCSTATRAKTFEALGIAGGAALSATAVGVASSSWFAKIGWTKLLIGVSAIGAATAVPFSLQALRHNEHGSEHRTTPAVESAAQPANAASKPVLEVPREASEPPTLATEASGSVKSLTGSRVDSRPDTSATPGLAEELAALDSARSRLAKGDPAGALARLDVYNRSYPKGRLQLEAEVLRIDALSKNGQTALAKKRAETFLRKYPNSVLASRVRALLGS